MTIYSDEVVTLSNRASEKPSKSEGKSTSEIAPCMLVTDINGVIEPHNVAAGSASVILAQINIGAAKTINDNYIVGETVSVGAYRSGVRVNMLVAAGQAAILAGDFLESAGDGTVRAVIADGDTDAAQRNSIVGRAVVDLDNSGSAVVKRIVAATA